VSDPSTKREVVEGRFELLGVLGTGAFGAVHEALDLRTQQRVAIKELTHRSPSALARFKQEFRALTDLHHPNLVGIRELIERNGRFLIAMELIEGSDFRDWVAPARTQRGPLPFDEHRLRQALIGVAQGLCALHEHGILHRDLKPSNIRVTEAGEAVLLDFGLVTTSDEESQSTQQGVLGTATYMAPEQARSEKLGPAADWYAFGVCLYEALTATLPFDAPSSLQVMMAKQTGTPAAPSTLVANLPRDLEQLCMKLLKPDPKSRAGAREVAQVLGIESSGMGLIDTSNTMLGQELFEGREGELEQIEHAANEAETGALRIVLVEGESGVGKSALVRQAIRRIRNRAPSGVLLRGRCYENEQVPYKAFDGCMDALARVLKRLNASESAELVPERAFLIPRLFPVLRDVRCVAGAAEHEAPLDPTTSRLEAFEALSTLLARLARRYGLTLYVDDLQWADAESFRLLRALAESAQRAGMLIIATVRPRSELLAETAGALDEVRAWPVTRTLSLHGLPRAQAHALASQLLGEGAPAHWAQSIAEESRGHPLFISALAQYAASHSVSRTSALTLDAALGARFDALKNDARALVDLVALAGRPYGMQVFARALKRRQIESATKELLVRKLVVLRADGSVDCFHNRIRQVAVAMIEPGSLSAKHRALARALEEEPHVEASDLARHWEAAGELVWALGFYERAGDKALESLAFARAESAYGRALSLLGPERVQDRRRLLVQRAHALARTGRCKDAALSYREAALGVDGEQRTRLHILAAQQLIHAAHLDEGLQAAREVLRELGVPLPSGMAAGLSRIAWDRACTGSFELDSRTPTAPSQPSDDALALEALYQLSLPVGWGEPLSGAVLNVHYLRRATRAGVPSHIARAMAQEGVLRALQHPEGHPNVTEAFEKARKLSGMLGDPAIEAFQWLMEGTAALIANRHRNARDHLSQATRILQQKCPGEPWLTTQARMGLAAARFQLGEHDRMFEDMKLWLAEADEREDRFARAALLSLGVGSARHLLDDDPDASREEMRQGISPWPRDPLVIMHFGEMINVSLAELYRGGRNLFHWFAEHQKPLDGSFLFRTAYCGGELALYRALAAVAAATSSPRVDQPRYLAYAGREAKKCERMRPTLGRPMRALLQAQISLLEGDRDRALSLARLSMQGLSALELVTQHAAGYLVGLLEGGDVGAQRCDRALGALALQRWKVPERAACIWAPAARILESPRQLRRPAPGLIGGRYRLVRTLGRGGFGVVVEAEDARTHTRVALKELSRTSPAALARFKREFRVLQDLHHPNLVRLDGLFAHEGRFFIAMELLSGPSFVDFVREQGSCDEERLRSALIDLLAGLSTLHEAGFLHRDLTPRNVMVTNEGRAVLLDFGLVGDKRAADESSEWVGTLPYVSPEQIQGEALDSASDAYALGVCIYEAITGELPFEASTAAEILRLKLRRAPMAPRAIGIEISPELEQVCLALLSVDPRDRPTLSAVRAQLLPSSEKDDASTMREAPFAGRNRELRGLHAGFARANAGESTLLLVVGESGVGKTALVAEFVRELRESDRAPLLLSGRCYENDQVAYKAFDGAMDELARHLRRLPDDDCAGLLPEGATVLTQLFPVFESVDAFAFAEGPMARIDPIARRMHAFEALSRLFSRVRERTPIVLVIDDLQWADPESFRLLHALLEGRKPPALFIIATLRPADEQSAGTRAQIEALTELSQVSALAVAELNHSDAHTLAQRLLGSDTSDPRLEAVVREGRGHPLFIAELCALASGQQQTLKTDMLTLDEALARRAAALSPQALAWLEIIAIAGRPVGAHLCARVLDQDGDYASIVASLLAQRLVRRGRDAELTCYHDRLRRVVLDAMRRARYSELCGRLANAMEDELHGDSAERAKLWCGAGELSRASLAYEEAGDRSLELLAFAQAEAFYGRALELLDETEGSARKQRLFEQRGHALSRAGRSAEAAYHYQEAAATAEGEAQIRLRTRAAQQLLQSAQVDEGMRAARAILAELNVYVPTNTAGALARLAWDRSWLGLRGLEVEIARGEIPRSERLMLDTVSELSLPMGWVDLLAGSALNAQHLRRALSSGDPEHVVRALAQEAAFVAMQNPQRLEGANGLFDRARELSVGTSPRSKAHRLFMEGTASLLTYQLGRCLEVSELAERTIESECAGEPWLLTNVRVNLGAGLLNTGAHAALVRRSRRWLDEAAERHDRFSLAVLSGLAMGYFAHLMQDAPQRAFEELRETIAPWPAAPLSLTHIGNIWAEISCALYQGGDSAYTIYQREASRLSRSVVARGGFVAEWFNCLEATAVLQALGESARAEMFPKLDGCIRRLEKPGTVFAAPARELILAQREFLAGNPEKARGHALAAERGHSALGSAHAWAATYLLGVIEGGEGGRVKREWILDRMRREGWRNPRRGIVTLGFGLSRD
jgi:serine/threonine protein kinase/predicted ATPase